MLRYENLPATKVDHVAHVLINWKQWLFHVVLFIISCGCYWNVTNEIYGDSAGYWRLYQLHDPPGLHEIMHLPEH